MEFERLFIHVRGLDLFFSFLSLFSACVSAPVMAVRLVID